MPDIPLKVIGVEIRAGVDRHGGIQGQELKPIEAKLVPLDIDFPELFDGRHGNFSPLLSITIHTSRGDVTYLAGLPNTLTEWGAPPRDASWVDQAQVEAAYQELAASALGIHPRARKE